MRPEPLDTLNIPTECPKCGKKALVRRSNEEYHCLWCGFHRNFSHPEVGNVVATAAFLALLFVILLANLASAPSGEKPDRRLPVSMSRLRRISPRGSGTSFQLS